MQIDSRISKLIYKSESLKSGKEKGKISTTGKFGIDDNNPLNRAYFFEVEIWSREKESDEFLRSLFLEVSFHYQLEKSDKDISKETDIDKQQYKKIQKELRGIIRFITKRDIKGEIVLDINEEEKEEDLPTS